MIDPACDRRSLLSGTALGVLAALLPRAGRTEATADAALLDVAMAVAATQFGALGAGFPAVADTALRPHLVAFLGRLDPVMRRDLGLLLRVAEYGPPLIVGRLSRFTSLGADERRAYLDAWRDHWAAPLRTGARALKLILSPLYFADDRTWVALGYDGPLLERAQIPYFELPPDLSDAPLDRVLP